MTKTYNYYADQLQQITDSKQTKMPFQVKFTNGENNMTNWMQLNDDSAKHIIDFLTTNFPNCLDQKTSD